MWRRGDGKGMNALGGGGGAGGTPFAGPSTTDVLFDMSRPAQHGLVVLSRPTGSVAEADGDRVPDSDTRWRAERP
jgi:hypothetical protein